jgi:hypothetical protein
MLLANNFQTPAPDNSAVSNSQSPWKLLTARFESKVESGQLTGHKQTNGASLKSASPGSLKTVSS